MSGDHNQYQKPDYVDRRQWKYDPMTGEPLIDGWPLYSGLPEPKPVAKYSDIVSDGGLDPRNKFDATPPQRQQRTYTLRKWVGLTDEEKEEATGWSVEHIEAKLKEKNA